VSQSQRIGRRNRTIESNSQGIEVFRKRDAAIGMVNQKHGIVFYDPSVAGYCLYYLPPNKDMTDRIKLTTEMSFSKAAKIVHRLNYQLFERRTGDDEIQAVIYDYLIEQGAEKYILRE
jgi:hypothetical protein